tara:strand:- start:466 stop:753 length:288 start_codon:yes stop_codon:yes gene_type:complete
MITLYPKEDNKYLLFQGEWLDLLRERNHEYMVRKRCKGVAVITAVAMTGKPFLYMPSNLVVWRHILLKCRISKTFLLIQKYIGLYFARKLFNTTH